MEPAIQVQDASVVADKTTILSHLSFTIPAGSITGLLGPSGAGKTTLIRLLLGLKKPTDGTVSVLGHKPGAKPLHTKIGYVTQSPSVYNDLSVRENLSYFAALVGANRKMIRETIKQVDLGPQSDQLVASLSGGQKARVSLAVALLGEPQLLLLDEPTVGLDPILRRDLWDFFRMLAGKGTTIVISSHAMDEADRCNELLFLRGGSLLASGKPKELRKLSSSRSMEAAFIALAGKK